MNISFKSIVWFWVLNTMPAFNLQASVNCLTPTPSLMNYIQTESTVVQHKSLCVMIVMNSSPPGTHPSSPNVPLSTTYVLLLACLCAHKTKFTTL